MGNIIPTQTRTIDPYSSYDSNVVNRLTRMVTQGLDCIYGNKNSLEISIDPAAPSTLLLLSPGICYKDDVLIQITDEFEIDMHDSNFYLTTNHFDEIGYYYIVIQYTYVKAKPAPVAKIKIIKPSEHPSGLPNGCLFLKAVYVDFIGGVFTIVSVHDFDPENTNVRRIYTQAYAGIVDTLPPWTPIDEGRIIYVVSEDEIYCGLSHRWESISSIRSNIDTTGCAVAQLVYVGSDGACYPAIATSEDTFADAVVLQVGEKEDGSGKVKMTGETDHVPIESGVSLNIGDKLFLSKVEAGSVTNVPTSPIFQTVGVCVGLDPMFPTECTIWFSSGSYSTTAGTVVNIIDVLSGPDWILSGGLYYADVNINNIGTRNIIVECYASSSHKKIVPYDVEIINTSNVRIWMPINTLSIDVVVLG